MKEGWTALVYSATKQNVIVLKPSEQFIFLQNVGPYYQTTLYCNPEAHNMRLPSPHKSQILCLTTFCDSEKLKWNLLRCGSGALAWWIG